VQVQNTCVGAGGGGFAAVIGDGQVGCIRFQAGVGVTQAKNNLAQAAIGVLELQVGAMAIDERGPDCAGQLGVLWGDLQPNNQAVFGVCIAADKDRGGIVRNGDGHVTCLQGVMIK